MSKPYRIAMIAACPFPYPRGTPARVLHMANTLSAMGHEVHVITYHLGDPAADMDFCIHRISDQPYYRKYSPGPSYSKLLHIDYLLSRQVARVLKERPFDLLHAHHFEGLAIALANRTNRKLPVIFDAHTLLSSELHHYRLGMPSGLLKKLGVFLDKSLSRRADQTIAVSSEIRDWLIQQADLHPEKIHLIPNGVEPDMFLPAPSTPSNKDRPAVLAYAGNLAPYQGIDLMLEAFRVVLQFKPDTRLDILTNSAPDDDFPLLQEPGVREKIDLMDIGFGELPAHLSRANILLNPRPGGAGFPLKLLNYMAAGKAIISFSGSGRGLVHGETGWLIDGANPEDFAQAILFLLDQPDLCVQLGENARQFAALNYSWEKTGERVLAVYDHAVEG